MSRFPKIRVASREEKVLQSIQTMLPIWNSIMRAFGVNIAMHAITIILCRQVMTQPNTDPAFEQLLDALRNTYAGMKKEKLDAANAQANAQGISAGGTTHGAVP